MNVSQAATYYLKNLRKTEVIRPLASIHYFATSHSNLPPYFAQSTPFKCMP
jgi:hypothetical protein